jgi:flagellar biosynthesis/type III secretory pathway protein FliH
MKIILTKYKIIDMKNKPTKEEKSYQELENKALELLEENVNYDEAELGCNWGMEELKDFLKSHLKEAYEAGQEDNENIATPQYKKDMQDAYEDGIAEERERIIKWAEKYMDKTIKYYGTDKHGIALDDLIQELTK